MMMGNYARALLLTGSAVAALLAAPASAQQATAEAAGQQEAAEQSDGFGDIVVTARRREERLQDVPVSVSAQNEEQLRTQGIQNIIDLGRTTPSLTVSQSPRGSNTPNFTLRGQRVIDTSLVLDPVVVTYFNEVPFMRPQGLNAALFDVNSVEVLRGPQGTLFGRNTTGGAVLIRTNDPTDRFEGNFEASTGNYGLIDVKGAINVPIVDGVALRLAGTVRSRDGYLIDRTTGYDANDENYHALRGTLRIEPFAGVVSTTYASYFKSNDHGAAQRIYAVNPAIASLAPSLPALNAEIAANQANPDTYGNSDLGRETAETYDFSNVTTIPVSDAITIKNVVGYRRIKTFSKWDIDGSSLFLLRFTGASDIEQFSEELQLQGESGNFDWIVGGFYFRENGSDIATSNLPSSPTVDRPSGVFATNVSYSAFASGTYRFGDTGLSLSGGIRYTWDERESDGLQKTGDACTFRRLDGTILAPPCLFHQEVSFKEPTWQASLNYKINDDVLVYLAHRHGYRSGGLQSRATTEAAAVPFNPEKVDDIELGIKAEFTLGGLKGRVNADVYQAWYQDIQRQVSFISPTSNTLVSSIFNAARSRIRGVEAEITLLPARGLTLSASVSYTDPKYREFIDKGVDVGDITPFGYIPKTTVNAQASYAVPVDSAGGELIGTASYRYQSSYYSADVVVPVAGYIPGWDLANLRIDYNNIGGRGVGLSAFVTNVFDEDYCPYATNLTASSGYAVCHVGAPRMYGVSARFEF